MSHAPSLYCESLSHLSNCFTQTWDQNSTTRRPKSSLTGTASTSTLPRQVTTTKTASQRQQSGSFITCHVRFSPTLNSPFHSGVKHLSVPRSSKTGLQPPPWQDTRLINVATANPSTIHDVAPSEHVSPLWYIPTTSKVTKLVRAPTMVSRWPLWY